MREIVPIKDMGRRLPEQGRIRLGEYKAGRPSKLSTFRFTSADKEALEQVAELYGGDVRPWARSPRPGEFELYTKSKEIKIALPPDPLGGTPIYEQWSGGGCLRRCDGEECTVPRANAEGGEMMTVPCLCSKENEMACKPKTRIIVILRDVKFGGGWRLETSSWNAMAEIPGMVDAIMALQGRGVTAGLLVISERKDVKNGQTKRFVVPGLALEDDIESLVSGASALGALAPSQSTPAIGPASAGSIDGDQAIEAEIVYDPDDPGRPFA